MGIKKINFSNLEFRINWASGSTIITLLVAVITLYLTNKSLSNKVDGLQDNMTSISEDLKKLNETVLLIKGSQEVTNSAIKNFVDNSPALLNFRINKIEDFLSRKFGTNPVDTARTPFIERRPE